jgi:hypothetical protein
MSMNEEFEEVLRFWFSSQPTADHAALFIDKPHLIAPMQDHDLGMTFFKYPAGNTLALMQEAPKGYKPPGSSRSKKRRTPQSPTRQTKVRGEDFFGPLTLTLSRQERAHRKVPARDLNVSTKHSCERQE